MDTYGRELHTIDISDLSRFAEPDAIQDFYLSPHSHVHRFLESEFAFIFNGFTLALCVSGECQIKINGRDYAFGAGSLLLLPPNQLMELSRCSEDFARFTIAFSLDLLLEFPSPMDADLIHTARHRPVLHLPPEEMGHLLEYYNFLRRGYDDVGAPYREYIAKTLLNALMLKIVGLYEIFADTAVNAQRQRHEPLADQFFILLAQYYKQERSVTFYAEKMNRTPKYISGEIKRITGRSIPEWLNEAILIEIKLQLKTTDNTILQISEQLNFSTQSVMIQFFKHHTGVTPLQYRKRG